jgi:hypothetical protein
MSFSHDSPKKATSLRQTGPAKSVAPLKPKRRDKPRPMISPSTPPGACGSANGRL